MFAKFAIFLKNQFSATDYILRECWRRALALPIQFMMLPMGSWTIKPTRGAAGAVEPDDIFNAWRNYEARGASRKILMNIKAPKESAGAAIAYGGYIWGGRI